MRRCKSLLYAGGAVHFTLLYQHFVMAKCVQQQQPTVQGKEEKMTHYTTQMDAARHGIITPQMEIVAAGNLE